MKTFRLMATIAVAAAMVACGNRSEARASEADRQKVTATDTVQHQVLIETTMGNILVALYSDTPQHRDNFMRLVREHVYDSLLFHRVIPDFMIQGGDPKSRYAAPEDRLGNGDLGYTVPAEILVPQHYHVRGALCAARQGDEANPQRRSSASQFYIVTGRTFTADELASINYDLYQATRGKVTLTEEMLQTYQTTGGAPFLDGQYTVFGEVLEGMDVVDSIQHVERNADDRPLADIRIVRATIVK